MMNLSPTRKRKPMRLGPRPLSLHFNLCLAAWLSSPVGLTLSASGWNIWNTSLPSPPKSWKNRKKSGLFDELQSANLAQRLLQADPKQCGAALSRAVNEKLEQFIVGVERYRSHPYKRKLRRPRTVWKEGNSRLLDYGGSGPVALFVPSLINRAYILDLDEERSMLRALCRQGIRPLLFDWGDPGDNEWGFGLQAYIERLERACVYLNQKVHLVGYCMGGNMALAAACRNPDLFYSLAVLATPWDFHAENKDYAIRSAQVFRNCESACAITGLVPVDVLQTLFTLLDPIGTVRKFSKLATMTDDDAIRQFIALEDWLNDGVPLTLRSAEDCLVGWYERNDPAHNLWLVGDEPIRPNLLDVPTLVLLPERDKIVPPDSAASLANILPNRTKVSVPLGHVGMIVSKDAPYYTWSRLATWLKRWRF